MAHEELEGIGDPERFWDYFANIDLEMKMLTGHALWLGGDLTAEDVRYLNNRRFQANDLSNEEEED